MTNNSQNIKPLVCVQCMTYNHENYIEDALNGFVMQKTDFPFVVAVVDDASTDDNASVIVNFVAKNCDCKSNYTDVEKDYGRVIQAYPLFNPNCLLHIVLLKENHYRKKPKRPYYAQFEDNAKYIACCEGDDYWIDRHKLQKQVDILEADTDCQLVFHNAIIHSQEHKFKDHLMCSFETGYCDLKQVFESWQLPLASVVFRRSIIDHPIYQELIKKVRGGWCYFIAAAKIGKVFGNSDCMSVYRKHDGGASKQMSIPFVIDVNYKFAYVAESQEAVMVIDKKVCQQMEKLYPRFLKGDSIAREAMRAAQKHNPSMPYRVLLSFIRHVPFRMMRKIYFLFTRRYKK